MGITDILKQGYNQVDSLISKNYFEAQKKRLMNKDFTIISNNCWGGRVYQDLGLPYKTPFVGLFLYAPCYIKLLKNLTYYLNKDLTFVNQSKYSIANEELKKNRYPIGILDDVEIHFLHYENEDEAKNKWERRLERINWDNLFIKFCDRDLCTEELLHEFDQLEYKNKVCFTAKDYRGVIDSAVWFSKYKKRPFVEPELRVYRKYFDVVTWLNQQS